MATCGASGLVYGSSGGKDSALVGILCKAACDDTTGVIMPCTTQRNYNEDTADVFAVAEKYGIHTVTVELDTVKQAELEAVQKVSTLTPSAVGNIAPRLRMVTLYAIAASENRLVVGTGNKSEAYVGYFTKWGDGVHDLNPISDLTVTEIYDFLRYLDAPDHIIEKAPSAALFDGQTDEKDMGVSYSELDAYLNGKTISPEKAERIERLHSQSEYKRNKIITYR